MMAMDSGSGHSGDGGRGNRQSEMAEMRFQEEIQSLIRQNLLGDDNSNNNNNNNNSSFTALLGLAPNQAMELLHNPHHEIAIPVPVQIEAYGCVGAAVEQNQGPVTPKFVDFPQFRCSPTFPSNAALVERAARYSVFASEGSSPETSVVPSNSGNNSSPLVKSEPAVSDSDPPPPKSQPKRANGKRKEPEKNKAKGGGKKTKTGDDGVEENNNGGMGGGEKLPYVHVRARRGQATDSHSLAERARREKINARMKLLQELVPGCSKISGTALVLDEIINHVQSLQRQVEFLSMKLAAVNPRIDFGGLDSFLAPENTRVTGCNGGGVVGLEGSMWPEINLDGVRRQQQIWQVDLLSSSQQQPSSSMWDRDDDDDNNHQHHGFITSGPLLFGLDSSTNPASLHPNQLKTEI